MLNVFECVVDQHNLGLVLVAALICLLGNIGLFVLLKRSVFCVQSRRRHWLIVAAVAEGVAVWATHFIAMLAYEGSIPIDFDAGLTLLSVAIPVLCFLGAFLALGREPSPLRSVAAGFGAAFGISAMHFTGIASIIAPVRVEFNAIPIITSIALSGLLFSIALILFEKSEGWWKVIFPTLPAVLSIVVLHFTSMSATTLVPDPMQVMQGQAIMSRQWLVPAIILATLLLISLSVVGAFIDRWLTDVLGLADATREGIAIVSQGRVIEVNKQLSSLIGRNSSTLIGSTPSDWLRALDGSLFDIEDEMALEARVFGLDDQDQIFEVTAHIVEYRGRACRVLAIRDLSDRKRAQRAIEHLASHDHLTDLPNRSSVMQALDQAIGKGEPFALLALDLDRFKAINDVFGHAAGDVILCRVAKIIQKCTRGEDMAARIGGDEFLVVQRTASDPDDARKLAAQILAGLATEMDVSRDPMAVGASIGVVFYPQDGLDAETLQQNADIALYRAKRKGRGKAAFFDREMDQVARERRQLEHDLRHAISRNQLRLVFQPLVATASDRTIGYEALLRWEHPERGTVSPEFFVPVAEEIGAIVAIGEWVLHEACTIAATWPAHLSIAVNVSTVQFEVPSLPQIVRDALEQSGMDPKRLELEITETAFVRNRENALSALHSIRAMGVQISMDDFGTGYSSLSNLKAFPFDKIKIDKSFVAAIADDEAARSIVRAIVGLGHSFNMPIVAEGVETEAQCKMVMEEGCPQAQGFYFGKPSEDPYRSAVKANAPAVEGRPADSRDASSSPTGKSAPMLPIVA